MQKSIKIQKILGLILGSLFFIFANSARATTPLPPTPQEVLGRLLPFIVGIFVLCVGIPIAGLIWYEKTGGKKKWPKIIAWTIAILFVIALAAFIAFTYYALS